MSPRFPRAWNRTDRCVRPKSPMNTSPSRMMTTPMMRVMTSA